MILLNLYLCGILVAFVIRLLNRERVIKDCSMLSVIYPDAGKYFIYTLLISFYFVRSVLFPYEIFKYYVEYKSTKKKDR